MISRVLFTAARRAPATVSASTATKMSQRGFAAAASERIQQQGENSDSSRMG